MTEMMLGWRAPEDRTHEYRYALEAAMPATPCPVVIGIPWYTTFDAPVYMDRAWYIGTQKDWGRPRGGHAVCARPPAIADLGSAYLHYNQGTEGACVGFAVSRAASLFNRKLYDGFLLYRAAQRRDPWPGEDYSGTSVNAGLDTLRLEGAWPVVKGATQPARVSAGIASFRWAHRAEEIREALQTTEPWIRILNSWGAGYPREVRMHWWAVEKLLAAGGEFGVPIDRGGR
jgi:hypothetical protein